MKLNHPFPKHRSVGKQTLDLYFLLISAVGLRLCLCTTILFMLYQLFSDRFGLLMYLPIEKRKQTQMLICFSFFYTYIENKMKSTEERNTCN